MDTFAVEDATAFLRERGYTVLPNERLKDVRVSHVIANMEAARAISAQEHTNRVKLGMGKQLGLELIHSDLVLWTDRFVEQFDGKVLHADVLLVIPPKGDDNG